MTTGQRIKARRKELRVPVEKIAKALNVSIATVYRYENGEIEKLPGTVLVPLSKILETTPAYIMGWTDDPSIDEIERSGAQESDLIKVKETLPFPLTAHEEKVIIAYRERPLVQPAVDKLLDVLPEEPAPITPLFDDPVKIAPLRLTNPEDAPRLRLADDSSPLGSLYESKGTNPPKK